MNKEERERETHFVNDLDDAACLLLPCLNGVPKLRNDFPALSLLNAVIRPQSKHKASTSLQSLAILDELMLLVWSIVNIVVNAITNLLCSNSGEWVAGNTISVDPVRSVGDVSAVMRVSRKINSGEAIRSRAKNTQRLERS